MTLDFVNFSLLFNYKTDESKEVILRPGKYLFECWGASGQTDQANIGGKGAYTKGIILLNKITKFYLYIGEEGKPSQRYEYSFNGGGIGQFGGGGATDIRYKGGSWNSFDSLKTRIMVAAGGGGPDTSKKGGAGGTIYGLKGEEDHGDGGTQTSGGIGCSNGTFGIGGGKKATGQSGNGGGGSGYYGGASDEECINYGGGGGSSFISGYPGCDAIKEESTENNITHSGQSVHYSGYRFKETDMISGEDEMPSPNGGIETGHSGHGSIRISSLGSYYICSKIHKTFSHSIIYYLILILFKYKN